MRLPGELRLKLSGPLDRGDDLVGGGAGLLDGDTGLLLRAIGNGCLHSGKPLQGLLNTALAAPSGHAGDGEYQRLGASHFILLV